MINNNTKNLYDEACFFLDRNKHNLYEIFYAMICKGIVPVCPKCGAPLISNENIQKNPLLVKKGILKLSDLANNFDDKDVCAFVKQNTSTEHIFSLDNGGTSHYGNLTLMHPHCNSQKHSVPAMFGINKAKSGNTNGFVYVSRGLNIHIYELLANGLNSLDKVPAYLLTFDANNEQQKFLNEIFSK